MQPLNQGKPKTKPIGQYFMVGVFFAGLALDAFDLWGKYYAPDTLARVACGLKPFALTTSVFVSNQLITFVDAQCRGTPQEPTFSILFFMSKLCFAIAALPLLWVTTIFLPANFIETRDRYFRRIAIASERGSRLRQVLLSFAWWLFICAVGLAIIPARTPELYVTLPGHKFFEDMLAALVFYTCGVIALYLQLYVLFLIHKAKRET